MEHIVSVGHVCHSGGRGLVPDWNYPIEGGARIERHVPVLPFSRDSRKYERLRKWLAAYRMVFGQARQEDLVAYLLEHVGSERIEELAGQLRIDLAPAASLSSWPQGVHVANRPGPGTGQR